MCERVTRAWPDRVRVSLCGYVIMVENELLSRVYNDDNVLIERFRAMVRRGGPGKAKDKTFLRVTDRHVEYDFI